MSALSANVSAPDRMRIAIVDAQLLIAQGIAALVSADDLQVVATASSWSELLAHPAMPVDVVLLDLQLGDGLLIATKVSELAARGMATVVISRRTDAASVASAMRAGARGFVATSDSPNELLTALRTAASGGHHLGDDRAETWRSARTGPEAGLGRQEERAIVLYSGGLSLREVATAMETTEETVKSYIKRARRKYRQLGIDVGTRHLLRQYATAQGWSTAE